MRLIKIIAAVFIAANVYASEAGGEAPSMFSLDFLFRVINFVILFGGIGYALSKPIKKMLKERSDNVRNAIMEARKAKEDAELKAKYYDEKLSGLEAEIQALKESYRKEAEEERDRIIKEYNEQIAKLKERMAKSIEQETTKIREELMAEASSMAIAIAEEIIRKNFNKDDQKRLVQEYIKMMERVN